MTLNLNNTRNMNDNRDLDYKATDYEVIRGSKRFGFTELFEQPDGKLFEITGCSVRGFIGQRVVVKKDMEGTIIKEAGYYHDSSNKKIVIPTGAITSARFQPIQKKTYVEKHVGIKRAIEHLNENGRVKFEHFGKTVTAESAFEDLTSIFNKIGVTDFDDMNDMNCYMMVKR